MVRITDRPQGLKGRDGGSDREDRFVSRSFKRAAAVAAIVLASLVAPSSAKGFGMVGGLLLQPRAVDTEAASRSNVNDYFQNGFGHNRMSEDGIRQLRSDIGTGAQRFATSQPLMEFALGLFTLSERSQGLRVSQTALQGSGLQRVYAQLTENERSILRDFATRYAQMTPVERLTQLGTNPAYTHLTQLIETQVYARSSPTGVLTIGSASDDLVTINTAITQIRTAALPPTAGMFSFGPDGGVAVAQAPQQNVQQAPTRGIALPPPVVAAPQVNQQRIDSRNHAIEDLETLEREIQGYQAIDLSVGQRALTRVQVLLQRLRTDRDQDPNGTRRVEQETDPVFAATQALLPTSSLRGQVTEARLGAERRQNGAQRAEAERLRREEAARVAAERAQQARDAAAQAQTQRAEAQRAAQQARETAVTERRQTRDTAVSTLDAFIAEVDRSTLSTEAKNPILTAARRLRGQVAAFNPNNAFTNAQQALIANANNSGSQSQTGLRGQFNSAVAQVGQVTAPATTVAFTAAQRRTFALEELQMLSGATAVAGMSRAQLTAMKREAARLRAAILRPRSADSTVTAAEQFLQTNFTAYRSVVFERRLSRAARENNLEVGRNAVAARNGRRAVTAIAPSAEVAAVRELVTGLQGENLVDRARLATRSLYVGSNLTTDQRVTGQTAELTGPIRVMHDAIRSGNVEEAARIYRVEQDNSRARLAQVREALSAERARLRALIPAGVRVRETNGRMAAVTLRVGQTTQIPTDAQLRAARRNMGQAWRNTPVFTQTPGLESTYNYLGTLDTRVAEYVETTRTSGTGTRRRTTRTPNEELSATAVLAAERNVTVAIEGVQAAQNGFAYARGNIDSTNISGRNSRRVPNPTYYRVVGASAIILREVVNPNWSAQFRPVAGGTQIVGIETLTPNRTTSTDPRGMRFAESVVRRNEAGIHGMQMLNGANYVVLPGSISALGAEVIAATQTSTLAPVDRERREKLARVSAARFVADQFEREFMHTDSRTLGETDTQTSARIALLERVLAVAESAETPETTRIIHLAQNWRAQNPGLTTAEVAQRARNLDAIIYSLPRIMELELRLETLPQNAPAREEAQQALTSAIAEFERTFGMRLTPNDVPVVRSDALRLSGQIAERALRNLDPEYYTLTRARTDITIAITGANVATLRERRRVMGYPGMSIPTQDTPLTLADQREIIARNLTTTINGYGGFIGNPTATIPQFGQIVEAFAASRFVAAVAMDNRRGDGYYIRREVNPEDVVNRGVGRTAVPIARASLTEAEIARQRAEVARGGTSAIITQVLRPDPLTGDAVIATRTEMRLNAETTNLVSIRDARIVGEVLQSTMGNLGDIASYARAHRNDANVDMLIEPVRTALRETMPETVSWNEGQFRRYILSSLRVIGEAQDTLELYGRLMPQYSRATTPITAGFELLPYELRQRVEQANLEIGRIPQIVIDQLRTLTVSTPLARSVEVHSSITISDPIYSESGNRVRFEVRVNEQPQFFQNNRVEVDAIAFVNIGSAANPQIFVRDPARPTRFAGMLVRNARLNDGTRADVIVPVREVSGHFVPDVPTESIDPRRVLTYLVQGTYTPDLSNPERARVFNENRDTITYPGTANQNSNGIVSFEFPNSGDTRIGVVVDAQQRNRN